MHTATFEEHQTGVTLNNASDYQTNGLYRTPNPSLSISPTVQ